jgi:hypothetical protein
MIEIKHCAKCGGPARVEDGQLWDQEKRKYMKCFRAICLKCGVTGPVREDREQATIAWNTVQAEVTENDRLS